MSTKAGSNRAVQFCLIMLSDLSTAVTRVLRHVKPQHSERCDSAVTLPLWTHPGCIKEAGRSWGATAEPSLSRGDDRQRTYQHKDLNSSQVCYVYIFYTLYYFIIHIKYVWLNQVNQFQSDGDHEECQEEWHRRRWQVLTDSFKGCLKNCMFYLIRSCALKVPSDSLCPFFAASDLSEQIKAATKDNHVRAENTQLMLSYQKGQITLPQYKVNATRQRPPVNTSMGLHVHCP